MTSKLTRERLQEIAEDGFLKHGESKELARMALAAMDIEPVILYRQVNPTNGMKTYWAELDPEEFRHLKKYTDENAEFMTLYRHTQPAPERDQVRIAHAEWSQATFGNVGPVGPLKHLSKEALEAAAEPGDLSEWADMQFLLWDAQRRAGITDEQITQAMINKLAVNKQREWPEPKNGEPRLHINEQPALTGNFPIIGIDLASGPDRTVEVRYVAPPGYVMVPKEPTREMLDEFDSIIDYGAEDSQDAWCRLLAATPQEVK
ncbi:Eaa1 [Klebsiella pneumoniae]|nr:Eaa1 [Klebsiella pneumoniae]